MADPKCESGCRPGCAHWPVSEHVGDPARLARLANAAKAGGSWSGSTDRGDHDAGNDRYTNR